MGQPLWVLLELILVGAASFCIAWSIEKLRHRGTVAFRPKAGDTIRLSCGGKVARCRFSEGVGAIWRLTPPLTRDTLLSGTPGATVTGTIAAPNGVVIFRSQLLSVDKSSGVLSVIAPRRTYFKDRRMKPRQVGGGTVTLEGSVAELLDLSAWGVRMKAEYRARRGERVRIDFPKHRDPVFGWVLDSRDHVVRVRFEDPFPIS